MTTTPTAPSTSTRITTPPTTPIGDRRMLLRSRRNDPSRVGAIAPTGRSAAARMAEIVPATGSPVVLELGAGTGSITRVLRERLPATGRLIAVESDPELVAHLRAAQPDELVVQADARHLQDVLDDTGVDRVDAVVSSLPLTLMPAGLRRAILDAAARSLTPDGAFVTITYRAGWSRIGRELADDVAASFTHVRGSGPIWANLPPARLVHGRGPRWARTC